MKKDLIAKILKILLTIAIVALLVAISIYIFPFIKNISTPEGQVEFKNQISNLGLWGFLVLFGLELAQIVLVFLPGEPIEILAGICYGAIGGTLFILVSVFIISSLIVFSVRKLGKRFIYNFFKKEHIDKIENSKVFKNSKTVELIFIILFLIPGTPKDLLVFIGGLLPINPFKFILISTFARFPSVVSSTIAGKYISTRKYKTYNNSLYSNFYYYRYFSIYC
ncbi:MAG: VTT domain-containing protein [Lachnospiraceae bacterium]|jgi:uncharacterized membrane protein YdjX (TVP38/TMEM64 family)|nr:VTT domain-containing protein [Lachnospiraceae bacterium]